MLGFVRLAPSGIPDLQGGNSLNKVLREMYGDQCGEFVGGYRGLNTLGYVFLSIALSIV